MNLTVGFVQSVQRYWTSVLVSSIQFIYVALCTC